MLTSLQFKMIDVLRDDRILNNTYDAVLSVFSALAPKENISTADWADKYRYFGPEEGATKGKYQTDQVYYFKWKNNPLDALDDPDIHQMVFMKSAQIAYTTGVMGNYIGKRITHDPAPMMIMFAQEYSAKAWNREKFIPMVTATPILDETVNLNGNWDHRTFPGGYLKLVNGNSIAGVKSSVVPIIFIEEPDDCNKNLAGQGDAIALAKERMKSFRPDQTKLVIGGTPTQKGVSAVDNEMKISDQRYGYVHCHHCNEFNPLSFDHFHIPEDKTQNHPVFGHYQPDEAYYACPACGGVWSWEEKNRNLRHPDNYFKATAKSNGVAGYYLNELYSNFQGSSFAILAEKRLRALHHFETTGEPDLLIAFINSTEGRAYEHIGEGRTTDELIEYGLNYRMGEIQKGGLILTAGVDVQQDRLELSVRAWGRGSQSWLVDRATIECNPTDIHSSGWVTLRKFLLKEYPAAYGRPLRIDLMGIDTGYATEQVYTFVRSIKNDRNPIVRGKVIAVKGSNNPNHEIFKRPRPIDTRGGGVAKYDRFGIQLYHVGTQAAKTVIHNWLALHGKEEATPVFYWSEDVELEYLDHLTSNVLVAKGRNYLWELRDGRDDESLDTEVYSLHAMQALNVHRYQESDWLKLEKRARYGKENNRREEENS